MSETLESLEAIIKRMSQSHTKAMDELWDLYIDLIERVEALTRAIPEVEAEIRYRDGPSAPHVVDDEPPCERHVDRHPSNINWPTGLKGVTPSKGVQSKFLHNNWE